MNFVDKLKFYIVMKYLQCFFMCNRSVIVYRSVFSLEFFSHSLCTRKRRVKYLGWVEKNKWSQRVLTRFYRSSKVHSFSLLCVQYFNYTIKQFSDDFKILHGFLIFGKNNYKKNTNDAVCLWENQQICWAITFFCTMYERIGSCNFTMQQTSSKV